MKIDIPFNFTPREYQKPLINAMATGIKRAVCVWHRRAGKDKTAINYTIKEMLKRVGIYYYFLPTYQQGKKVIWDGIDGSGFKTMDHFPKEIIKKKNEAEMKIELKNGSLFQMVGTDNYDAIRGTNPVGCVFSEYSFQDPQVWDLIRPILRENGGWAIFVYCVTGDTLIMTENGLEEIGRDYKKGFTKINEDVYGLEGKHKAISYYSGGKQDILKIKTNRGYHLNCTPVHPIWDGETWIKSQDLKVGDKLPIQRGQQIWGNYIPKFKKLKKRKSRNDLPKNFLNKDFMYLMGLFLAEGWSDKNKVVITTFDKEIQDFLVNKYNFKEYDKGHFIRGSQELASIIEQFGMRHIAKEKEVPLQLLQMKKEYISAFLSGYFDGDGCSTKRGEITSSSASKKLTERLQILLLNYGIVSSVRKYITKPTKIVKVESIGYRLEISGYSSYLFYKQIGFKLTRKQERINTVVNKDYYGDEIEIKSEILRNYIKGLNETDLNRHNKLRYRTLKRLLNKKKDKYLQKILDDNFYYDEIKSIEKGREDVYDFVIPETHSFFSNGLVSHNTPYGENHGFDLYSMATTNKDWFCQKLTIEDTGVVSQEDIETERAEGMSEEMIQQEYYCFPGDTDIIGLEGVKEIKDVSIGDFVLTHSNRYRKVQGISKRAYNGEMIKIKTLGNRKDITCTLEHRIRICNDGVNNMWVEAKDLVKGDRVTFPKVFKKNKIISKDLVTLLAWYITEGSSCKGAVQYTLDIKEKKEINGIKKAAESLGYNYTVTENIPNNTINISVNSVELIEFLVKHCGSKSYNKKIPFDLIGGYEEYVYKLLIDGDGHRMDYKEMYSTVSKTLAYQVQLLAHSLGYRAGILIDEQPEKGIILGREVNLHTRYSVNVYPKQDRNKKGNKYRVHKYNVTAPIIEIEKIEDYDDYVYNLDVMYDSSYTANGRVVHNCSFGGMMQGAYYATQYQAALEGGRIMNVPYQKDVPVDTWWDLGVSDATAIWFSQTVGREFHLIDYLEESGEGLPYYLKLLQEKPYVYGQHNAPHDIKVRDFGSGLSRIEVARKLGLNFTMVPNVSIQDGINASRVIFNQCYFDATKCADGLRALRNYHKSYDNKRKVFANHPDHDWSSNGADAFRYFSLGIKQAHPMRVRISDEDKSFYRMIRRKKQRVRKKRGYNLKMS